MSSLDRSKRIRDLFDEVVNLRPEERADQLADACGEDEALRHEVESLLEAADARGSGVRRALEGSEVSEEADHQVSASGEIPTALQGALADRYTIVREIGSGGMATVYLAEDLKHHRKVALKVLDPDVAAAVGAVRFLREIETAANLTHPHILPLHDSGEAGGFLYYVMPYVEGESLRDRINREGSLPVPDTIRILREVADALGEAHVRGVVHRDIKPANILLSGRHALVADFGVAKSLSDASSSQVITTVGVALGTPAYMAPEQASGEPDIDHRADLFALGVIAYEMLTGRPPFSGRTTQQVLAALLTAEPEPIETATDGTPADLAAAVMRCLEKNPEHRWQKAQDLVGALESLATPGSGVEPARGHQVVSGRKRVVSVVIPSTVVLTLGSLWFLNWRAGSREVWLRAEAIPEIQRLAENASWHQAHALAMEVEAVGDQSEHLADLWGLFSVPMRIESDPPGAAVFRRAYGDFGSAWEALGETPVDVAHFPRGCSRLRLELSGYQALEVARPCSGSQERAGLTQVQLVEAEGPPVVFVPGGSIGFGHNPELEHHPPVEVDDYWIDRFEVTNREYKRFVDSGCYQNPECWPLPFVSRGRELSWEEVSSLLVDATGRPGPSTWEVGQYPEGQADYPVTGVSWFEAVAFAVFEGRELPTIYHWLKAASKNLAGRIVPLSNLEGAGPAAVGHHRGVSSVGAFDMAGNAREWVFNESDGTRFLMGGGWADESFRFFDEQTADPMDRSEANGFRLVSYGSDTSWLATAQGPLAPSFRDYRLERPVSDEIFSVYLRQFQYDREPLNAVVEAADTMPDWIRERITFDAAYGSERMILYLFIPRIGAGPYQPAVFFPGATAVRVSSIDDYPATLYDFFLKSGRAFAFPVYKGSFERKDELTYTTQDESASYRDHVIQWGKDLARSIDYLETREDIDAEKLAYFGHSWGGRLGGVMLAIEPRIKVAALSLAGFNHVPTQPEVDPVNYVPRISVPVLVLSGRYDAIFPLESSARPMFDLIGTPFEHKRHVISEEGHSVPRNEVISEVLSWLDRYLGPVRR